jgi:hypothetical protein
MAILMVVSLLMLNVRVIVCQEAGATKQRQTEKSSTQQQEQSVQSQGATPSSAGQTTPAKLDGKAQKIKRTVEKIGVAGKLTLYLKNGEELYGSVVRYDESSMQIAEVDLKQVVTVQYINIKKVRDDYGKRDIFTGKRSNPSKGIKIGIFAGVLFVAIGLPLILVASAKD